MREWDEGERMGSGCMDKGVGCGREQRAGLDGWGSGVREREGGRGRWMEE